MILQSLLQQNEKICLTQICFCVQVIPGFCILDVFKVCFTVVSSCIYCKLTQLLNNSFIKIEIKVMFSPAIFIPERASKTVLTWWAMAVVINIQNMWRKHLLFIWCGPEEILVAELCQSKSMQFSLFTFGLKRLMLPSKHIYQGIESCRIPWKEGIWTVYSFTSRNQSFLISNALLSPDRMGISCIML